MKKCNSSSVNLEEKVQKVTNLLIQVSKKCLGKVKIKKKSKDHEYFDSDCYIRGKNCKDWYIYWKRIQIILLSDNQTERLYESMIKSKKRERKELKLKLIAIA